MFNAMMDGIKEESVGALFNLQVEVQQNPVTDEEGAPGDGQTVVAGGIQMSAGPEVTATPQAAAGASLASAAPVTDAEPDVDTPAATRPGGNGRGSNGGNGSGQAGGRSARGNRSGSGAQRSGGGRHRSTGSTGAQPVIDADTADTADASGLPAGLAPRRASALQYTAPSVDGGTHVESHVEGTSGSADFSRVGRNDPCPCGSGRKFKRCHGDPKNRETV
jgi:preprotein translocase subunit SecA